MLESGGHPIWIQGEISNFKRATSGHCYFKLKDEQSQLTAVMWRSLAEKLKFDPAEGMAVQAIASLKVYQKGGYYQLDVHSMQQAGKGALYALFEELKSRLDKEGLFDPSHKRPLPQSVRTVGVVTAKTGAAVRDIIRVIADRSPQTDIVINDVLVQGDKAPADIARGIAEMNSYNNVEVIIVGRGGGSIEDLWAFNTEVVARAIFNSKIPVVSAVGHEIDFTIADFVADLRAPTPSAAAEMVVNDEADNLRFFQSLSDRFDTNMSRAIISARRNYTLLKTSSAFRYTARRILDARQTIDTCTEALYESLGAAMQSRRTAMGHLAARLSAVSPLNVLARGYAVVTNAKGVTIKTTNQIALGERITIQLHKGLVGVEVKDIPV